MKKILLSVFFLTTFLIYSQGQLAPSSEGFTSSQNYSMPASNRSVPPGFLVWSQTPDCEGNIWATQLDNVYPFDARVYDDFLFDVSPGQITAVRWWIGWWNDPTYVAPSSFNIYIYEGTDCTLGNQVGQWNIPFAEANEDGGCLINWPSREYWALLNPSFTPVAGQHYWLAIQPVMIFPPQTGILSSSVQNLCTSHQYFDLLGTTWNDLEMDMAFELYSPGEIPVSNWALLLGGMLIAVAVFMRYRRSL